MESRFDAMGTRLRISLAALVAVVLLVASAVGSLIGLEPECNGAGCPRSDAYRDTLLALPLAAATLLLAGGVWTARLRRAWPLVLAVATTLALESLVGVALDGPGAGTAVLLAVAVIVGGVAWRSR
jgi:hypothetical protein